MGSSHSSSSSSSKLVTTGGTAAVANSPIILTIHSSKPKQDANVIATIFHDRHFRIEDAVVELLQVPGTGQVTVVPSSSSSSEKEEEELVTTTTISSKDVDTTTTKTSGREGRGTEQSSSHSPSSSSSEEEESSLSSSKILIDKDDKIIVYIIYRGCCDDSNITKNEQEQETTSTTMTTKEQGNTSQEKSDAQLPPPPPPPLRYTWLMDADILNETLNRQHRQQQQEEEEEGRNHDHRHQWMIKKFITTTVTTNNDNNSNNKKSGSFGDDESAVTAAQQAAEAATATTEALAAVVGDATRVTVTNPSSSSSTKEDGDVSSRNRESNESNLKTTPTTTASSLSFFFGELQLPSGCTIVFVTPQMMNSVQGRQQLASHLLSSSNNNNSMIQMIVNNNNNNNNNNENSNPTTTIAEAATTTTITTTKQLLDNDDHDHDDNNNRLRRSAVYDNARDTVVDRNSSNNNDNPANRSNNDSTMTMITDTTGERSILSEQPTAAATTTTTTMNSTPSTTMTDPVIANEKEQVESTSSKKPTTKYKLPKFPSLQVQLLGGKQQQQQEPNNDTTTTSTKAQPAGYDFPLNSREPVNIETDLFIGKILFLVRPLNPQVDDPYWNENIFSKKKRRIVLQIQGKFKRIPDGVIYAGVEITEQMKLGLITRGICTVLLKLVDSFNNVVHSSFGDSADIEYPHIVVPAYTFFERFIISPPNQIPPNIMETFPETKESIKLRKGITKPEDTMNIWNTVDTYSMSFYSMYIDLPTWSLIGVPVTGGDLSLKTFWNDSLMRIVMYEKKKKPAIHNKKKNQKNDKNNNDKKHSKQDNNYAFVIQTKFLGMNNNNNNRKQDDEEEEQSEEQQEDDNNENNNGVVIDYNNNIKSNYYDDRIDNLIELSGKPALTQVSLTRDDNDSIIGGGGGSNASIGGDGFAASAGSTTTSNRSMDVDSCNGPMHRSESELFTTINCNDDDDDIEASYFFDAEEEHDDDAQQVESNANGSNNNNSSKSHADNKEEEQQQHQNDYHDAVSNHDYDHDVEILALIDKVCPAWVEVASSTTTTSSSLTTRSSNNGSYNTMFAINKTTTTPSTNTETTTRTTTTMYRSLQSCEEIIKLCTKAKTYINEKMSSRISSKEKIRRILGLALSNSSERNHHHGMGLSKTRIDSFLSLGGVTTDGGILSTTIKQQQKQRMTADQQHNSNNIATRILMSGYVLRALSDRHWIEEWAKMDDTRISFHHPEKQQQQQQRRNSGNGSGSTHFRLSLDSILDAKKVGDNNNNDDDCCPNFPGRSFIVLQTLGRSVYLMLASNSDADAWLDAVKTRLDGDGEGLLATTYTNIDDATTAASGGAATMLNTNRIAVIDNPADEFLHKSTMWNCKNRRLLNCRLFHFRTTTTKIREDPLSLVSTALRLAMQQHQQPQQQQHPTPSLPSSKEEDEDDDDDDIIIARKRLAFFDSAAALKRVQIHNLSEDGRLTFFLNLYHVMIQHAYLVLGPPNTSFKWITYFNGVAYQVGDDIFSITELEHCIIRSKMVYPTQFISRFVLPPKSRYHNLELTKSIPLINFALNAGSTCAPSVIFIYNVNTVHQQLEEAAKLYLRTATLSSRRGGSGSSSSNINTNIIISSNPRDQHAVILSLPRVCQWFASDFGTSQQELIKTIMPYLPQDISNALSFKMSSTKGSNKFETSSISIKYQPYSFDCRPLQLAESGEAL